MALFYCIKLGPFGVNKTSIWSHHTTCRHWSLFELYLKSCPFGHDKDKQEKIRRKDYGQVDNNGRIFLSGRLKIFSALLPWSLSVLYGWAATRLAAPEAPAAEEAEDEEVAAGALFFFCNRFPGERHFVF